MVSGILLILPTIGFALAAPVLVQEKRQAGVDVVHLPKDVTTMWGKRGDDLNKLFLMLEDHFPKPEESSAARPSSSSPPSGSDHEWTVVEKPPPSIPEKPSPVSSPGHAAPSPESLTESGYGSMKGDTQPGPSIESDHESMAVHAPLSTPVFPAWFLTDHGYMGPHAPKPNQLGLDSDDRLVVEEPPSGPASPTKYDVYHEYQVLHPPPPSPGSASSISSIESDHDVADVSPSSSVLSTNPDRRSMGADSRLGDLQVVRDALKGNAKEWHPASPGMF